MAIIKLNNQSISAVSALPAGVVDAGALASGVGGALKLLSVTNFSGSTSYVEVSLDYSDHENFLFVCDYLEGTYDPGGQNCDLHFKREGQGSFDTGSTDYGFGGILHDTTTVFNVNQQNSIEIFRGGEPSMEHAFIMNIAGVGNTTSYGYTFIQENKIDAAGGGQSSFCINGVYYSTSRVTDMRFSFTAGNVKKIQGKLYGYGE